MTDPCFAEASQDERLAVISSPPLTWRPYRDGDLDKVAARDDMAREMALEGKGVGTDALLAYTITTGISWNARPLACGFVTELGPTTFGISALVSSMSRREWVFARKCLISVLDDLEARGAGTIVAFVRADFGAGILFLARLGFEVESRAYERYAVMVRRA